MATGATLHLEGCGGVRALCEVWEPCTRTASAATVTLVQG